VMKRLGLSCLFLCLKLAYQSSTVAFLNIKISILSIILQQNANKNRIFDKTKVKKK
jgi:hypothetical protein